MDEKLRESLSSLVPRRPDTGDWGAVVRKRRRRRIAVGSSLGAVALAVSILAGAMVLPGSEAPLLATPAPQASPTATPSMQTDDYTGVEAQGCADLRDGRLTAAVPSGDLPTGATRAWLCGPQSPMPFAGQLGPREPLTDRVDRIVEAFNALPEGTGESIACTEVGGLTYSVVLEYPDGVMELPGETVNCAFVAGRPGGGAEFLGTVEGYWDEARSRGQDLVGEVDMCANRSMKAAMDYTVGYGSFLDVRREDAVRGVVCSVAADAQGLDDPTVSVPIPSDLVAELATGELTPFEPGLSFGQSIQPAHIVLLNRFGDPVSYGLADDGAALVFENGQNSWLRPADSQRWAELLSSVRITPFYDLPDECGGYDPATMTGDPSRIVAGIACAPREATPTKGPELDLALAREIGQRFSAEAAGEWGAMNSANFVVLIDSDGAPIRLYWDGTLPGRLVSEPGNRSWPLPDDIRIQLEAYGLTFEPE